MGGLARDKMSRLPVERDKRMKREIANSNERRRMQLINSGFQQLKALLPDTEDDKRSKSLILHQAVEYITKLEGEKFSLVSQNAKLLKLMQQQNSDEGRASKRRRESSDGGGDLPLHDDSELMGKVERLVRELKSQLDVERKKRLLCERQLDNFRVLLKKSTQLSNLQSSPLLSPTSSSSELPSLPSPSSFTSSSFLLSPPLPSIFTQSSGLLLNHPVHATSLPPQHTSSSSSSSAFSSSSSSSAFSSFSSSAPLIISTLQRSCSLPHDDNSQTEGFENESEQENCDENGKQNISNSKQISNYSTTNLLTSIQKQTISSILVKENDKNNENTNNNKNNNNNNNKNSNNSNRGFPNNTPHCSTIDIISRTLLSSDVSPANNIKVTAANKHTITSNKHNNIKNNNNNNNNKNAINKDEKLLECSVARRNLETIVQAIRHLEGDQLPSPQLQLPSQQLQQKQLQLISQKPKPPSQQLQQLPTQQLHLTTSQQKLLQEPDCHLLQVDVYPNDQLTEESSSQLQQQQKQQHNTSKDLILLHLHQQALLQKSPQLEQQSTTDSLPTGEHSHSTESTCLKLLVQQKQQIQQQNAKLLQCLKPQIISILQPSSTPYISPLSSPPLSSSPSCLFSPIIFCPSDPKNKISVIDPLNNNNNNFLLNDDNTKIIFSSGSSSNKTTHPHHSPSISHNLLLED